ncbi:hypothetical protein ACFXI8_13800 [Streptomyces niveus]|uniref:hypothetical protein n=1 Tax=Streptomyces niveus TaxID=193462 RepID=UPI0036B77A02
MNHPRFLFVLRPDADTAPPGDRSLPERSAATGGAVSLVWRLVGPNNRGLGQSWRSHPDQEACRAAVRGLREGLTRARPLIAITESSGLWTWRLDLDGERVAVSVRPYQRQRECHYSLENFFRSVPHAPMAAGLVSTPARRLPYPGADRPSRPAPASPTRATGAGTR